MYYRGIYIKSVYAYTRRANAPAPPNAWSIRYDWVTTSPGILFLMPEDVNG